MSEKQRRKAQKQQKQQKQRPVREEVKIAINIAIRKLLESPEKELPFPTSYSIEERAYIHKVALALGLNSKSRGKGSNRFVTVYKKDQLTVISSDAIIKLQNSSKQSICNMLFNFPLSHKECHDLLPPVERKRQRRTDVHTSTKAMGRLNSSVPQVPHLRTNFDVLDFRKSLPICSAREDIIRALQTGQVVIIAGETGSGKTTQVPQYILEYCQQRHQPCRIICTQPRRISAVSVAERVAYERDEKIGQTFGYQIRLESRVGPKTLITFCTNGVLLRTLMGGDTALSMITHIIVDEVHERDRFCDFLLISLKNAVTKYKHLKLVLMSATMDTSIFAKYFNNCAVISVPGRCYDVERYYLEDILKITGYMTKDMLTQKKKVMKEKDQQRVLESWTRYRSQDSDNASGGRSDPNPILAEGEEKISLDPSLVEEMDRVISKAWLYGGEDYFAQLLHYILSENVPVDYQHSQTTVTPLMVSAGRGCIDTVEQLINLGANLFIQSGNEWTALDWAKNMNQTECAEMIEVYMKAHENARQNQEPVHIKDPSLPEEDQMLLDIYHRTFNDENIDYDLLLHLILYIHRNMPFGSLLIFLPGYDDIVAMKDKINGEEQKMNHDMRYNLYILHSKMQTSDQKKVFKPSALGTRKIILSTNIAETSITIDDVVYVIDSGKIKEKSFDALSGVCTFQSNWISQACAKQRSGRAGRCRKGICYHLFSSVRYNSMQPYQTPEILRLPLQELCLYTKHLSPGNESIAEFLDRALEPPSNVVTRNAVQLLKTIDALDPWEDLTELGSHLLDLPVEPRFGKMLLYSVVLKCLDPVLTIVCSLAYNDPFILPVQPALKTALSAVRKKFAMDAHSDHMAMLRAFQGWQHARATGVQSSFCQENFISAAVMEMIVGMRTQLLGQLRASGFVRSRGAGDIRDLNCNSENWAVVKAALTAGLYPNLIRVDRKQMKLRTQKESRVFFHPSSTLRETLKSSKMSAAQGHIANLKFFPTDWLLYEEMSRAGRICHAKMVTLVTPLTVALFSGPARLPMNVLQEAESVPESDSDSELEDVPEGMTFKLDNWITFKLDSESAQLFLHLRQKWNALFLRRMKSPGKAMSQLDEKVISALVTVLTNEEKACGLQQPSGIGQRPRPLIADCCPVKH